MSNMEDKISEVWDEIIVKEKLRTIIIKIDKLIDSQINNRIIIKEELTNLWNTSEIPVFKQILEKLTLIQNCLEQKEAESSNKEVGSPEDINITKNKIILDLSKSKPKVTKGVKKIIKNLAELSKQGKF